MPGEFDMGAAVTEISEGLGFSEVSDGADNGDVSGGSTDLGTDGNSAVSGNPGAAGDDDAGTGEPLAAGSEGEAEGDPATTSPTVPDALRTWRKEAAALFPTLPKAVQDEILKREEDIFKGIEGYRQRAEFGDSLKVVLDPYMPILSQYNISPQAQVKDMMQSHYILAFGTPQQKQEMVQRVFKDYNLDPAWLTGQSQSSEPPAWVDPAVEDLRSQVKNLQSSLSSMTEQQQQAYRAEVTKKVEAFATDPKNIYFVELADDIAQLIRSKVCTTVEEAYERALWANPAVRAKELKRQAKDKQAAERAEAEARAKAAREVTEINVRTRGKPKSAATPKGSMDDTLRDTLAAIEARG